MPIRYACVDAVKAGYDPVHQCKQIESGAAMTFNSIAMFPAGTGPDAGIDAPIDAPRLDAAAGPDASDAASADAGTGSGDPDGCCATGHGGQAVAMPVAIVVLALRRARRRSR